MVRIFLGKSAAAQRKALTKAIAKSRVFLGRGIGEKRKALTKILEKQKAEAKAQEKARQESIRKEKARQEAVKKLLAKQETVRKEKVRQEIIRKKTQKRIRLKIKEQRILREPKLTLTERLKARRVKLSRADIKRERLKREREFIPKLSIKQEIETLRSFARKGELFGVTATNVAIQNLKAIKEAPKQVKEIVKEIRKDPQQIKKVTKEIPNILKEEGKAGIELFKTSPTEAIGVVAGEVLFFGGTGKVLKLIGKVAKRGAKIIKSATRKPKGTKVIFIGSQSQKGNRITTKIVFKTNKKEIGGAVGVATVKGNKLLIQTVGKVGKVIIKKGELKKVKPKSVFIGREIAKVRPIRKRVRKEIVIARGRKLRITRSIGAVQQLGIGRIAEARGQKLLSTVIKFPTGKLVKKKVKGLKVSTFASLSTAFTRKDLSLIVGRTLKSKKDLIDFIGIIKGTSGRSVKSFSANKQKLFRVALKSVVGTVTASTKQGQKVLPKLSPKVKRLITTQIGVIVGVPKVVKVKVVPRAVLVTRQKQLKLLIKEKKAITFKEKLGVREVQKQRGLLKTRQKAKQKQKTKAKLVQAQKGVQKLKLKSKILEKQIVRTRAKGVKAIAITKAIPLKVLIGLVRKRKRRRKRPVKARKPVVSYNVFARPTKKRKGKKQKLIKINKVPLTKTQAQNLGSFVVDKSLSRTFTIKKLKGIKPKTTRLKVPAKHFRRTRKKFRSFKIVKGKRVPLRRKQIEKRKHLLDTRSERRGITLRRKIAQLERRPIKKRIKRKATPQQLKNLAKGRKTLVQMRKVKGGKK